MRLIITFAALFSSVLLLQIGIGGVAPLDALSGIALGFSNTEIGLLGSAHYAGFFAGCWWAPRVMGMVGYSRAFAAFVAAGTISILAHMMWVDPLAWTLMRVISGVCVAGCYTIIEAWLQGKVTNATRGRTMGLYRVVDIGGSLVAQMFIAVLEPASFIAYNLLTMVCCAALLPLSLTRSTQPVPPEAPRLRPAMAWRISPLATVVVVSSGITGGAFRMVGPIYGAALDFNAKEIALLLVTYGLGGAVAQMPIGWLADRMERRRLLTWLSLAAVGASLVMIAASHAGWMANAIAAFIFGFTTFPLYSIATAHAHDQASDDDRVELTASLLFLFALGAIASPLTTSLLIGRFGATSMFVFLAAVHMALILYGLRRATVRAAPPPSAPYVYVPRTSFLVGRLIGRGRDR